MFFFASLRPGYYGQQELRLLAGRKVTAIPAGDNRAGTLVRAIGMFVNGRYETSSLAHARAETREASVLRLRPLFITTYLTQHTDNDGHLKRPAVGALI